MSSGSNGDRSWTNWGQQYGGGWDHSSHSWDAWNYGHHGGNGNSSSNSGWQSWDWSGDDGQWADQTNGNDDSVIDKSPATMPMDVVPVGAMSKKMAKPGHVSFFCNDVVAHADGAGDDGADDDAMWEGEAEAVSEKKLMFWASEKESRLRTGQLLPFECHQMLQSDPQLVPDMKKVITTFGLAAGGGKACRRALKALAAEKKYTPGMMCEIDTPEFSLCKHLLISAWAYQHNPGNPTPGEKCFCFPQTSLMIMGCQHTKRSLLKKLDNYTDSLCITCSTCLRCGGFLGPNQCEGVCCKLNFGLLVG